LNNAELQEFAQDYTDAWCSLDPKRVAEFYAENGSLTINDGVPSNGREAIARAAESYMVAFPDLVLEFDGLEFEDDRVNYHWTFRGTNSGPGGTGNAVHFSGYESWELNSDGRIESSLGYYDNEEYQRQLELGVEPE